MKQNMKNILCDEEKSLIAALELFQMNGKRMVFVVDKEKHLMGVLTDGDIRRWLLAGKKLSEKVKKVMKKDFVFGYSDESQEELIKKMNSEIIIIPIVNRDKVIVDYLQWDQDFYIPVAFPELGGNELRYLTEAFISTWISSAGEYIQRFEQNFAKFCGTKYAVATSNGTTALHLALVALGIKKGDEVIVPDFTFAATINAVLYTGATPVIVDVEKDYWTIDPKEIKKAITKKTKAIIPVHLYGQPCNMDEIMQIAKKNNLFVIEDCAEAHGASFGAKKVGNFGEIGCFSFYGNKIITTGEGGMCTTNSEELYEKMRVLRDHGMSKSKRYWHEVVGFNYRMTNLQAAIGCAQLEKIEKTLQWRGKLEDEYRKSIGNTSVIEFQKIDPLGKRKKITWLICVIAKTGAMREKIIAALQKNNIDARPFFYPLASMPIYKKYLFSNKNSKIIAELGLNVPTQYMVASKDILKIKNTLNNL